jgi:hypothetical protein
MTNALQQLALCLAVDDTDGWMKPEGRRRWTIYTRTSSSSKTG